MEVTDRLETCKFRSWSETWFDNWSRAVIDRLVTSTFVIDLILDIGGFLALPRMHYVEVSRFRFPKCCFF